jgi:hypothetical protein
MSNNFKIINVAEQEFLNQVPVPQISTEILDLNTDNRTVSATTDVTYLINNNNLSNVLVTLPTIGKIGAMKTIIVSKGAEYSSPSRNIILSFENNWGSYTESNTLGTTGDIIILVPTVLGWAQMFSYIK